MSISSATVVMLTRDGVWSWCDRVSSYGMWDWLNKPRCCRFFLKIFRCYCWKQFSIFEFWTLVFPLLKLKWFSFNLHTYYSIWEIPRIFSVSFTLSWNNSDLVATNCPRGCNCFHAEIRSCPSDLLHCHLSSSDGYLSGVKAPLPPPNTTFNFCPLSDSINCLAISLTWDQWCSCMYRTSNSETNIFSEN